MVEKVPKQLPPAVAGQAGNNEKEYLFFFFFSKALLELGTERCRVSVPSKMSFVVHNPYRNLHMSPSAGFLHHCGTYYITL